MTHGALIEVASLRFRWPSASAPCLAIESFRVKAGERIFPFDPSGSGKSTLLAGVLTAQEGSVRALARGHPLDAIPYRYHRPGKSVAFCTIGRASAEPLRLRLR